jgi:hypothetical protein
MTIQNYSNFDTSKPTPISEPALGVDRQVQAMYRDLLSKPVPDRFLRLLSGVASEKDSQSSGAMPSYQTNDGTS